MLVQIMRETGNFFLRTRENGTFTIENNALFPVKDKYYTKQYIAITGSISMDGVYQVESLSDSKLILLPEDGSWPFEEFKGCVYGLAVPKDFIELAQEIESFIIQNPRTNMASYSFGISSASYSVNKDGVAATWREVFADRLKPYRSKMFKEIPL